MQSAYEGKLSEDNFHHGNRLKIPPTEPLSPIRLARSIEAASTTDLSGTSPEKL
nr:hypothetical protein [uncultured bacterium]